MLIGIRRQAIALLTKAATLGLAAIDQTRGWWRIIGEPFTGAWQRNLEIRLPDILAHPTVFACITLIAGDIAKMRYELVRDAGNDVWVPVENPAFSPVIRRPNAWQTREQFARQWIISKLISGNTYVFKTRDQRGVVTGTHVLDPYRVRPLVSPDGSVFYELHVDNLAQQFKEIVPVPASEIMHDHFNELFHPLLGISPLYAAGIPAMLGLKILTSSTHFFGNGSTPGGILYVPGTLNQDKADELKRRWEAAFTGANAGRTAVIPDGMKFEVVTQPADKSQLSEQWNAASQAIAIAFHVPWSMVGGPPSPYSNPQANSVDYLARCLQPLLVSYESVYEDGIGIDERIAGVQYGLQFRVPDLLLMDTLTMTQVLKDQVGSGLLSPDEGRAQLNYGKVTGGGSPYLQQQNFSLEALARRDAESTPPGLTSGAAPPTLPPAAGAGGTAGEDPVDLAATFPALFTKAYEAEASV